MADVRTRFAPSPTGHLHIGSVRTALFNFLYARAQGGTFLLRIEDTDRERSKPEYEASILGDMAWLGLTHDGPVVKQSERLELYRKYVDKLLSEEKAYKVDPETPAVKFKMPKKKLKLHDLVHGEVEFDTMLFEDLVLIKSDGMPTYSFACVVDDHEQGITHVIRGDDHLSNTPRQWLLYEALGLKPPKVAHIPLIVGEDRTPLSKRHGNVSLYHYRERGCVPAGLLNYLALLGWSPGGNQEFFSMAEAEKKFRLKAVGRTSAAFDEKKLAWLSGRHLKSMDERAYLDMLHAYLAEVRPFSGEVDKGYVDRVALLYRSRINTLGDFTALAGHCFKDEITVPDELRAAFLTAASLDRLRMLGERLSGLDNFDDEKLLESTLRTLADEAGIKAADLIHPARVALTGFTVSPGLFELMKTLGKDRVLRRLSSGATRQKEV